MKEYTVFVENTPLRVREAAACVVGSGAAGYHAALRLWENGVEDTLLVTEGVTCGTSRNTGSDKQTYYKMSLSSDGADSPRAMAEDLFACGSTDGDTAYAEACGSVQAFLHLKELGVPFPVNCWGEFVGYQTDHDPRQRASSAGPLTSKLMTQVLEQAVQKTGLPVLDGCHVISVLKQEDRVCGLLALDAADGLLAVSCRNVIFAVGGPAGIYADRVYPDSQFGSTGLLLEAGCVGQNLAQWQYGLASVQPRWNVSGTYLQVLPKLVSVEPDGTEHEFGRAYFGSDSRYLSQLFLKGYQWPFDASKAAEGSSVLDLLVSRETKLLGRRVYLDFRENPCGLQELPYETLDAPARDYLSRAGACFGKPIDRLEHLNAPAVELYRSKGVDLHRERLEIALCAQHHNGGVGVDAWWQTAVPGLFAAGEAAGTHGVRRPGGSALNAGQVGSGRAARYIAAHPAAPLEEKSFLQAAEPTVRLWQARLRAVSGNPDNAQALLSEAQQAMSACAGAVRRKEEMEALLERNRALLRSFSDVVGSREPLTACRLYDALLTQCACLSAMLQEAAHGSRGSAVYPAEGGLCPPGLPEFAFRPDDGSQSGLVQETRYADGAFFCTARPVRPLPEGGGVFETVWREYRENGGFGEERS